MEEGAQRQPLISTSGDRSYTCPAETCELEEWTKVLASLREMDVAAFFLLNEKGSERLWPGVLPCSGVGERRRPSLWVVPIIAALRFQ